MRSDGSHSRSRDCNATSVDLRLKASQLILAKRADEAEGKLRKALQVLENAHRLPVVQADQERADSKFLLTNVHMATHTIAHLGAL